MAHFVLKSWWIAPLVLGLVLAAPRPIPARSEAPGTKISAKLLSALNARKAGPLVAGVDYIPRLTTPLSDLALAWRRGMGQGRALAAARNLDLEGDQVHIRIQAVDVASADALIQRVERAGGRVSARYKRWVAAWVPADVLEDLAGRPGLEHISRPQKITLPPKPLQPTLRPDNQRGAGNYLSQGVAVSNARVWHSAGITGQGIKVAVLDIGFKDYTAAIAAGELPAGLATLGTIDTTDEHGTACAEIVYDTAPGAAMTIACAFDDVEFAQRVDQLAAAGNKIISCSVGTWGLTPGDGTGVASQAINDAYNNHGVLFCQGTGINALHHYDDYWRDTADGGDDVHEFVAGQEIELNQLGQYPAGYIFDLRLRWNAWPTTDQDYDLYLASWTGSEWAIAAYSTYIQDGTQPPFEYIYYETLEETYYGVAITKRSASGGHFLSLMSWAWGALQYNQPSRSLDDASAARWSYSVATLDVASPYALESYSSWGPAYGPGGVPDGGNAQPYLSGYTNVDTWVYGSQGSGGFYGNAPATATVAGAAALVWSAFPAYSAMQVRQFLEGRASDMGALGYDYIYGYGRLWLGSPPSGPSEICLSPPVGLLLTPGP